MASFALRCREERGKTHNLLEPSRAGRVKPAEKLSKERFIALPPTAVIDLNRVRMTKAEFRVLIRVKSP